MCVHSQRMTSPLSSPAAWDLVASAYADEVTTQFVLTGHVVGYDMCALSARAWDALKPEQRTKLATVADKEFDACAAKYNAQEKEVTDFFKAQGLQVYTPDVNAFRAHAQKKYLESAMAQDWPKGMLERINAIK